MFQDRLPNMTKFDPIIQLYLIIHQPFSWWTVIIVSIIKHKLSTIQDHELSLTTMDQH